MGEFLTTLNDAVDMAMGRYWSFGVLAQLLIPIVLIAYLLPRRGRFALRAGLSLTALLAAALIPVATNYSGLDVPASFVTFTCLLAVFAVIIWFTFDASIWTSLFCASAGYTIQNIASGSALLVQMLVTGSPRRTLHGMAGLLVQWGIPVLIYVVSYLTLVRSLRRRGLVTVESRSMPLMLALTAIAVIGLDLIVKDLVFDGATLPHVVLLRLVHLIVCAFILFTEYQLLYARRADDERAETERLLAERERQYRLSQENIEAINVKCHDIRHQIRHLAERGVVVDKGVLDDIAREVDVYDSTVKTGNEALDTILTEKRLMCSTEGIELSVVADGSALDFMVPADIYALFGNALDNAVEAVRSVADPEHRVITLLVQRRRDMVSVNVENYRTGEPAFGADGLPRSTKADHANHGFGMRSMRSTAERYGGSLHAGVDGDIFYLNVLLDPQSAR